MTAPLRIEHDGGVAILTLDRTDVLNAFDEPLTTALAAAMTDVAVDPEVRCVVITGAGRAFSAGQDLGDRAASLARGGELRLGDELRRRYHPTVIAIREMRKPVIAAVNGVAAGAGLGLAVSCDVRVAAESASFRAAWSKVGLVPDAASVYFLPRLVGWGRAIDIVSAASRFRARTRCASVWWPASGRTRCSPIDGTTTRRPSPRARPRRSRSRLNASWDRGLRDFLEVEAGLQDRAGRSSDYAEGVRAFLEKRPPRFTGS